MRLDSRNWLITVRAKLERSEFNLTQAEWRCAWGPAKNSLEVLSSGTWLRCRPQQVCTI